MSRARVARAGLAALIPVAALIGLAPARAVALASDPANVLYEWTDAQGNVRYTPDPDRIPSGRRDTMRQLDPSRPPADAPARPLAPLPATGAIVAPVAAPDVVVPPIERTRPAPAPVAQPSAVAAPISEAAPVAPPGEAPAPSAPAAAATREQQLSAAIAADQEALKRMLAAPPIEGETALVDSPQLREIARRLPELQAELRALRERQTPPAGP